VPRRAFQAFAARRLDYDSEQTLLIVAPEIRPQRLGLADDRVKSGKVLREAPEPTIDVDVVDNNRAPRPQNRKGLIHLETNVALAMETVMDEEIDPEEARD